MSDFRDLGFVPGLSLASVQTEVCRTEHLRLPVVRVRRFGEIVGTEASSTASPTAGLFAAEPVKLFG